jgi:hypothetical protein
LDFFFLLVLVDEVDWSVGDVLWVCANAGATTNPSSRHTPAAQVSTLIRSVLIPISSFKDVLLNRDSAADLKSQA